MTPALQRPFGSVRLSCAKCRAPLDWPDTASGTVACSTCAFEYQLDGRFLRYNHDVLLFDRYRRKFLLNKVLNNNATISYMASPEGSLSLAGRADVMHFRDYLEQHASAGRLLDIGCGLLERPGYLDMRDDTRFEFFGLDPMDDHRFFGWRVTGCAELMPFADAQFQTVVFATSLDHVCELDQAVRETARILAPGGRVVIWMGDRAFGLLTRLRRRAGEIFRSLQRGYRTDRYVVYPDLTVLYRPAGAADPFHSYHEDPRKIERLMTRNDLAWVDTTRRNADEVFLCFERRVPAQAL